MFQTAARSVVGVLAFLVGVLCVASSGGLWSAAPPRAREADRIRAIIEEQARAWNKGDLDGFMDAYLDSEELRFFSGGNVTKGRRPLFERYRKRYQAEGKEKMGKLTFSELDVTVLADDAALVRGRWKVVLEKEAPEGLFTLLMRRYPSGWKIVHDHTSQAEPPKKR